MPSFARVAHLLQERLDIRFRPLLVKSKSGQREHCSDRDEGHLLIAAVPSGFARSFQNIGPIQIGFHFHSNLRSDAIRRIHLEWTPFLESVELRRRQWDEFL